MAKVWVKSGDVLSLPTGDGRIVLGQVVDDAKWGSFFLFIFDTVLPESGEPIPFLEIVASDEIRLIAKTSDVFVELGRWDVVGNAPVRAGLPMPVYKVAMHTPDNMYVEDWTGTRRRPARPGEIERIPRRSSYSPAAVAHAVRASLGLEPWIGSCGTMRPGGITTAEVFGES